MTLFLCDATGEFFLVEPGRRAARIASEGDLLDPYLIARLEPTSRDYEAICEHNPDCPDLGIEIIRVHPSGCWWCDGSGTYRGPCQYRLDEQGWYAWGPSDEPGAPHGAAMCPECRGTGRWYEWTGIHLTKERLNEWCDNAGKEAA